MNPKVSVIIPVYNGEKTLEQCLKSVLSQNYDNYEVLVVDNHSTDRTKEIISRFRQNRHKISYAFEGHRSRGAARNKGVLLATGEIIAMTDSDCIVPKNWITDLIGPIIDGDEDIVMGLEKDLVKNYWTKNIQEHNIAFNQRNLRGRYINVLDTKNFAVKSTIMKEWMFDRTIGNLEDFELAIRIRNRVKIRYKPTIKVGHYHKSSFRTWIKLSFERGYWARRIYDKHKHNQCIQNEPMLESTKLKNLILFPLWMGFQFLKRPIEEVWFIFVSEIGWRAGLLFGKR